MGILKYALPALALAVLTACAQASRYDLDFNEAPDDVRRDWNLTKQRCSGCHKVDRAFLNMALFSDRGDVEGLVEDMAARRGSGISDDDVPRIVNALDWHRTRE
jgi:hypothetical protein